MCRPQGVEDVCADVLHFGAVQTFTERPDHEEVSAFSGRERQACARHTVQARKTGMCIRTLAISRPSRPNGKAGCGDLHRASSSFTTPEEFNAHDGDAVEWSCLGRAGFEGRTCEWPRGWVWAHHQTLARAVELAQCFFQVVPLSVLCVLGMFLLTNRVAAPVLLV